MCVDCTSLNKACPKDSFPLRCIDQVVDSTLVCEILCFLDAYSDQLVTSFITPFGSYYYVTMPFLLKNAGLHTNVVCSSVFEISLGGPLRHT
jgi:hypothetical protein